MNLRLAVRSIVKNPSVTVIAIVSLALGIGANAAIFSLFDQILLRTVPVHEPERLVNLSSPGPRPGNTSCFFIGSCDDVFSYPMFRDLQEVQTSFTDIAAQRFYKANWSYEGETQSGLALWVSGSYFSVLGVPPALGRLLEPSDERAVGEAHVVVLSHAYWSTRFNANPSVLNQQLIVNGQPMTIVGVTPALFNGTTVGITPKLFVPITMLGAGWSITGANPLTDRRNYSLYLFARLKPGVSIEAARVAINGPYHRILYDVEAPLQRVDEQALAKFKARTLGLEPGKRGQSQLHRDARAPLLLLIGLTALVLLIACANIANLLLARAATRSGEMAIRLSLGGTRGQLMAQMLTESSLLSALGGAFGLLVARWTLTLIASVIRPEMAPVELTGIRFSLDRSGMLVAAALTMGTGILFGLFPALHSSRPDLFATLKGTVGQPGGTRATARFRWLLATTQIALSMALLILAGLFTRSLLNASHADLGFRTENLITFSLSPRLNGYSRERSVALYKRIEDQLRAIPDVIGVTSSNVGLFAGDETAELWETRVRVQGFPFAPDVDTNARFSIVGADYFRTVGIPLIGGRDFSQRDAEGAPKVAIVNEKFVEKFNLGDDVIGKRIGAYGTPLDTEIIGVARDAKYSELRAGVHPEFFLPYRQRFEFADNIFCVRIARNPRQVFAAIPQLMARIDSRVPIDHLRLMPEQIQAYITLSRVIGILSAAFAAVATLLAAIGLYGVLTYTVTQRTREFGVRMALGAERSHVRWLVLGQVAWMTGIGGVIGFGVALALGRLAESLLFQLSARDPLVLGVSEFLLVLVAFAAGLIPAHRASRLDPLNALRYE